MNEKIGGFPGCLPSDPSFKEVSRGDANVKSSSNILKNSSN